MEETKESVFVELPLSALHPHPENPRKDLGDLTELADSIKASGVLQNLTVVPGHYMDDSEIASYIKVYKEEPSEEIRTIINQKWLPNDYTIIIGHRRAEAARLAGLESVPCIVRDMDHNEQLRTMMVENMQRSDLTAYEQAQGFQLMFSLGDSVEEIAKKSGFSKSTIRKRLKMAELDREKLKEVSSRQLSLGDFDRLATIEDLDLRNKVLDKIGTRDFDSALLYAKAQEERAKRMPMVNAWLQEHHAKELKQNDTWSSKYVQYPGCSSYIKIDKWGDKNDAPPKNTEEQVYYYMDSVGVKLLCKAPKKEATAKSEEQLRKEAEIKEAWNQIEQTASVAYELRKAFVEHLSVTDKNELDVMRGGLLKSLAGISDYIEADRTTIRRLLGIQETHTAEYEYSASVYLDGIRNSFRREDLAKLIYATMGDSEKLCCTRYTYKRDAPEYRKDTRLEMIYLWLGKLGYELSTEEEAMMEGRLEAYGQVGEK